MKITVLYGGTSPEREVSLNSGRAVAQALTEAGHDASLYDIRSIADFLSDWPQQRADCAFIALHGGWGEDGRLQSSLEAAGIPYTGSDAESCRLAMDKELTRLLAAEDGLPVAPGIAVLPGQESAVGEALAQWGKIVIKPAWGGSTVAVTITSDPSDIGMAMARVWEIDNKAIVEKFIPGKELTVTVFDGPEGLFALPAIEIRPHSGFYDYTSKYTAGRTEYLCPAPLEPELTARLAEFSCRAFRKLGCRTYARADFRLDGGDFYLLELNTAPGMTATSLVPKASAAYGWSFPQLLDRIVRAAV